MSNFSEYIDPSWEFGGDRPCDIDNTTSHVYSVSESITEFYDGNINLSELIETFDKSGIIYSYDELTGLVDINNRPIEPREGERYEL